MAKPKVAIFDFSSCEGCELQIVNCEDELLDILDLIEIVNFREAMSRGRDDYEIALVEGGLTSPKEIDRIKAIRERAKLLVAIGSCASTGGINCLKNTQSMDELKRYVYGAMAGNFETSPARPLSAEVKVDLAIPGCPMDKKEFARCLTELLAGRKPFVPDYPMCVECKIAENVCQYDLGHICLGPVTRAGCGARCPSNSSPCDGCRGLMARPNLNSARDVMVARGLSVDDVISRFRLFQGYFPEIGALAPVQEATA